MLYSIDKIKKEIAKIVVKKLNVNESEVEINIGPEGIADFSVPLFKFARIKKKSPAELAKQLEGMKSEYFSKIKAEKGYLNFFLNIEEFNKLIFSDFEKLKQNYGKNDIGKNKTIVIDYSSPNIGKPMSIAHLRSTIIGDSLYRIFKFLGYKVIGDNHLGDWGLQYGQLLYAYKHWLNKDAFNKDPVKELLRLYVKFNSEAEKDPSLKEKAKEFFAKLEKGDKELLKIWKKFVDVSLKEFKKVYNLLGIKFDYYLGESFYVDKAREIVKEALAKGVAKYDEKQGIVLIDLSKYGLIPLIIQKSDESTLYATRDLATAKYRLEKFKPEKILYVVGSEQKLYFNQVFKALELLGYKCNYVHVGFGLIVFKEGKLSTRRGRIIFLEEIIKEAIKRAEKLVTINVSKKEKEKIAKIIGIGAVKFNDLSQDRIKDVEFSWDKLLNLKGRSAPYIQYTYVRANSILRNAGKFDEKKVKPELLKEKEETELVKQIALFPEIIKKASNIYQPYLIANYLYKLAETFHRFYETLPVLKARPSLRETRLMLVKFTAIVIKNGLYLLGIDVPGRM